VGEITWGKRVKRWRETRRIEPSTAMRDESLVRVHLLPAFGSRPLRDIIRHEVQAWVTRLLKTNIGTKDKPRHLAGASAARIVSVLVGIPSASADAGLILANPATREKLPPASKVSLLWFTAEEYAAFVDAVEDPRDIALVDFLVGTGLRWYETAGLHWSNLDIQGGQVVVREVWTKDDIRAYSKTRDQRDLPLLPWVTRNLNVVGPAGGCGVEHRDRSVCRSEVVFTAAGGGPLDDRNWSRRVLQSAIERAGRGNSGYTIYTFRHTYASWLVQTGAALARVAQLMGHKSITTTETYAHLAPAAADDVRLALPQPTASTAASAAPSLRIAH